MTSDRWHILSGLIDGALTQAPEARDAWLRKACGDDSRLYGEVTSLLASEGECFTGIGSAIAAVRADFHSAAMPAGTRLGPYRLVRLVGQGGMGAVYEGIREDTFQKRVAIKLVKHSFDSDFARRRFQQERQILARLDHPNIARLLDGGDHQGDFPYLVMEFVEGEPLLAAAASLGIPAKLRLFQQILSAVSYAHRNLIVHRDLKPANILVSPGGDPKLLDFGIARLMEDGSGAIAQTVTSAVMLTPDYASPEQVKGEPAGISSDIYSLGAILYELLCGVRPHRLESYSTAEVYRAICEVEPPAPSAATADSHLRRELRGDLDTLVLHAMDKDPAARYASAEAFSAEVEHYLSGRPLTVRPASAFERAWKFVKRNRLAVGAGVAVAASLIGGITASTIQARRAEQRFAQVRALANTFLFQFHDEIRFIPGTTRARAMVVKTALQYLDNLSHSSGNDPALKAELAQAYRRVADAQASPNQPNLGDSQGAIASLERAVSLYDSLDAGNLQYLRQKVDALRMGALILANQQKGPEAIRWMDRATAAARPFESDPHALGLMTNLYCSAGDVQMIVGSGETAEPYSRKAVEYIEAWARTVQGQTEHAKAHFLATTRIRLARSLLTAGRLKEAATEFEITAAYNRKALAAEPENLDYQLTETSILLSQMELYGSPISASLEKPEESLRYARAAEELLNRRAARDPNDFSARSELVGVYGHAADALYQLKRTGAVEEVRRSLKLWKELREGRHLTPTDAMAISLDLESLVPVLGSQDKREAVALARDLVAEQRQMGGTPDSQHTWYVSLALSVLGAAELAAGDREASQRAFDEAAPMASPVLPIPASSMADAYLAAQLVHLLRADRVNRGACAEAREWWQKEVEVWRTLAAKNEYAAMRLHRAESDPRACQLKP
ncbi:MAG TPA: serine/threonine-protein kinase [Bryobacteraceae bacterium]|nr:serine/threonine-protein kinase [Bryobacteraceae bacterium]